MKANLTDFGLQRRLPLFLTLPSPHAPTEALCADECSPSQRLHADQTSNHRADVAEPTCSASKAPHPNLMKVEAVLNRSSSPYAPHHAETRLCISLPFSISFIANIARKRPELNRDKTNLLERLFEPIATDRRGEIPDGAKHYMEIPPFSWHDGKLTVFYQRQYIDSAQRFAGVLKLTPDHVAALDMFDAFANDPALHFGMCLRPGDMQFVYNHSQLHDRTGFTDWPDPDQRRHLLRLWLTLPGDRALPESFIQRYGSIEIGNRGGIVTAQTKLHAPLD